MKVPLSPVGCRGPPLSAKGAWRCARELALAFPRRPWAGAPMGVQRAPFAAAPPLGTAALRPAGAVSPESVPTRPGDGRAVRCLGGH